MDALIDIEALLITLRRNPMGAELQAAAAIEGLEAACSAMLQRWAIIHNLLRAGGEIEALSVAGLSADEFVQGGAQYGAARLMRQEEGARALRAVLARLNAGTPVEPGSAFHEYLRDSVVMLSSYPERAGLSTKSGDNPVD